VSDICLTDPRHRCLTVDSLSEAKTLAIIATNYINTYGTSDSLFVTYFGATDSSTQLEVLSVRLGYPGSNYFSYHPNLAGGQ
jgi:hypothetical protein